MDFDRSRVYSSVNADDLRAGDNVIVADTLSYLRRKVADGNDVAVLEIIRDDNCTARFGVVGGSFNLLAYLVERAENCINCGEGKWDAEHKKILCDPAHCGNGNVVFRNQEIEVCEYWKPKHDCQSCKYINCGFKDFNTKNVCDRWEAEPKTEPHYRPFKDTDELIKVWCEKGGKWQKRELTMPYIWVCSKDKYKSKDLITGFNTLAVSIGIEGNGMQDLFNDYTFLDGSPCGVEE